MYDTKYDIIRRSSDMLYMLLKGEQKTHSELIEQATLVLPIVLRNSIPQDSPAFQELLIAVVDMYEVEVGVKTFTPNALYNNRASTYWLHQAKDTVSHAYFDRYKLYLRQEGFPLKTISNIEYTCERILASCANPRSPAGTDKKRGLVVGDVQSGKTANYLGLINMAFDYGYKIVVLLAGTTNSLRLQTQKRTDSGVIGAKSDSIGNMVEYLGVGIPTRDHFAVPFTNQSNDFAKFIQNNLNSSIGDYNKPVILVVKKIKSILESVGDRLQSELDEHGLDSKSILIIDDEADNASPNTSKSETNPTVINRCIRTIFNKFPISSYVGFTATPFANVFINPYDDENYMDLFPNDFIVQLNSSDTYFGGRKVFPKGDGIPRCLRVIKETESGFLPVIHDRHAQFFGPSDSLREAIHSFLINNVIRTLRGQTTKHRSMMINITRFNDVQTDIWEKTSSYIENLTNVIEQLSSGSVDSFTANKYGEAIYRLYCEDPFYEIIRNGDPKSDTGPVTWEQIQNGLYDEIKQIQIVVINSRNGRMDVVGEDRKKKRFDYEDFAETGARVIAIGGMVLSRGLTLEGLMISYYSRNAGTYDTLLQMCRWFGYRPGYQDLCRVYLSQENIDRFDAVLEAVEDLKIQFAEMDRQGKKPKDFGLMVKECPDTLETTLLVTARNKMRQTDVIQLQLSYGGVYADTSKLSKDPEINSHNLARFMDFAAKIPIGWTPENYYMASNVSNREVARFIAGLKIPYVNKKFDTEGLSEYIGNSQVFTKWDVVVATGTSGNIPNFMGVEGLKAVVRSFHTRDEADYIRIGGSNNRVLDPGIFDAGLNLDEAKRDIVLQQKDRDDPQHVPHTELSAKDYLKLRQNAILVIYPIDLKVPEKSGPEVQAAKDAFPDGTPLLAFAIGFPCIESSERLMYRANRTKLDELEAKLEISDEEEGDDSDD